MAVPKNANVIMAAKFLKKLRCARNSDRQKKKEQAPRNANVLA